MPLGLTKPMHFPMHLCASLVRLPPSPQRAKAAQTWQRLGSQQGQTPEKALRGKRLRAAKITTQSCKPCQNHTRAGNVPGLRCASARPPPLRLCLRSAAAPPPLRLRLRLRSASAPALLRLRSGSAQCSGATPRLRSGSAPALRFKMRTETRTTHNNKKKQTRGNHAWTMRTKLTQRLQEGSRGNCRIFACDTDPPLRLRGVCNFAGVLSAIRSRTRRNEPEALRLRDGSTIAKIYTVDKNIWQSNYEI